MIKIIPSLEDFNGLIKSESVGCGCGCGPEDESYHRGFHDGIEL